MRDDLIDFTSLRKEYEQTTPYKKIGKITASRGIIYEANLPKANIGSNVEFITDHGDRIDGEVVGIKGHQCLVMPYGEIPGINSDTKIILKELTTRIYCNSSLLGRVVDYQGCPIDDKGPLKGKMEHRSIYGKPINPLKRPPIREPLDTGIRAINAFTTSGKGQRLGIFAGSGVGKSVLLGMMARNTKADVNVIALIGERGREVREFIESDLGEEGLKKSIIVVATSDMSPLIRAKAAYAATTIAEHFRDEGKDVLLMMDSITRFAMANREISLSAGEPPGQKGYAPSVFAKLAKLMERAGTLEGKGTITGFYTVLVEGGDFDEPIADAVRSISDGHILLSRKLATQNHFPAIDILESISRVMNSAVSKEHKVVSGHLRNLLASYRQNEDLISVGAYVQGSNPNVDKALLILDDFNNLLKQDIEETSSLEDVYDQMVEIAKKAENINNDNDIDSEATSLAQKFNTL